VARQRACSPEKRTAQRHRDIRVNGALTMVVAGVLIALIVKGTGTSRAPAPDKATAHTGTPAST
jgi:hypothetical protein